jgi:hypothetical protein
MVIKPRQTGVIAICDCGSKQFIPSESAIRTGILYCPCGQLEKIDMSVFNEIFKKSLRSHLWKKTGRPLRPAGSSGERGRNYRHSQGGIRKQVELDFVPIS